MTTRLEAEGIRYGYERQSVLDGISLAFDSGELVSILGPNGSGKTTLLKILLGILPPRSGQVRFDQLDIRKIPAKAYARKVAYVPQMHRIAFPHTVEDVVSMGRLPHQSPWRRGRAEDRAWVRDALARLGIDHLRARPYTHISGGERQLTLIARAVAQGARTLIMDEPTSALDYGHQIRLLRELERLCDEGYTCIKSTHAPEHALWASGRVILLKDGKVIGDGCPREQITSSSLFALYRAHVDVTEDASGAVALRPLQTRPDSAARR